jgi:hypothetical protein
MFCEKKETKSHEQTFLYCKHVIPRWLLGDGHIYVVFFADKIFDPTWLND